MASGRRGAWFVAISCIVVAQACGSSHRAAPDDDSHAGDDSNDAGQGASSAAGGSGGVPAGGAAGSTSSGGRGGSGGSGGTAGSGGTGQGGSANSGGASGSTSSQAGEAGEASAGGSAGSGGIAGSGGSAGSGGVPIVCNAGPATDHVNDALPCADEESCNIDELGRTFSPPIRIDDGTSCVTRAVVTSQSNDSGIVTWADQGPYRVQARSTGANATWENVELAGSDWGDELAIASRGGDTLLAGTRQGRLLVTESLDGGAWSPFTDLGPVDPANGARADVAIDSTGVGLAVWNVDATTLYWATWSRGGGWSTPAAYSRETIRASVAPIPGGGFAMARIVTGTVALAIHSNGVGWTLTGEYVGSLESGSDDTKARASIGVDSLGEVHVAWTTPHVGDPYGDLFYDRRDPNGIWEITRGFTTQGSVDPSAKPLFRVAPNGNAILGWHRLSDLDPPYAVTVKEGLSWSEPRDLFGESSETAIPAVAIDDAGNALVVWARNDPMWGLIHANRYFVGGTGWESSTSFILYDDQTGGNAKSIAAALSPSGEGLIAYVMHKDGEDDRVFSHTLR